MKFSKFNLYLENYPEKDATLIYNTLTKATVVISEELKKLVENTPDKLTKKEKNYLKELNNLGIIVEDELDESLRLNHWYNKTRFSNFVWNGVIIPSTDCDLSCTYCYQEGAKTSFYMKKDIQEKVLEWYKKRIEKDRPKQIFWAFFGGEPLLNIKAIDYLTENMKKYCDKKNVIFQFSIITNGTNLNKKNVIEWNKSGLVSIQITLDGDEETHNRRRPFKNGKGSFEKIYNNLKEVCSLTDIILRLNIDADNIYEIPRFLEFLKKERLEDKLTIFYGLLLEANEPLPHQKKYRMKEIEGARGIIFLRNEAIKRGFKVSEILEGGPCIAKSECSVMIDPKGKIYKCTGHVGLENLALGDISSCGLTQSRCRRKIGELSLGDVEEDEEKLEQKFSQYVGLQLDKECLDCKFAPICLGGCPYKSWTKYRDLRKKVCEKPYYETVYKDVLKQMYREQEVKEKWEKISS
jgi:uncharacterized protein